MLFTTIAATIIFLACVGLPFTCWLFYQAAQDQEMGRQASHFALENYDRLACPRKRQITEHSLSNEIAKAHPDEAVHFNYLLDNIAAIGHPFPGSEQTITECTYMGPMFGPMFTSVTYYEYGISRQDLIRLGAATRA